MRNVLLAGLVFAAAGAHARAPPTGPAPPLPEC